jgi:HSP20 family protein
MSLSDKLYEQFFNSFFKHIFNVDNNRLSLNNVFENLNTFKVDIFENNNEYSIECDLCGINKEDIKISIEDFVLKIETERKLLNKEEKSQIQSEIRVGLLSRTIQLPIILDTNTIKAEYNDGVLSIIIKKINKNKAKYIKIE